MNALELSGIVKRFGPLTAGVGSMWRSTFRSGPEGGRALFSAVRIRDL